MYTLFYDSKCPICTTLIKILRRKIPNTRIRFQPLSDDSNEFKLTTDKGHTLYGKNAIDELARAFPAITTYFNILPKNMRVGALQKTVKVASAVRSATNALTGRKSKGCNCGRKR